MKKNCCYIEYYSYLCTMKHNAELLARTFINNRKAIKNIMKVYANEQLTEHFILREFFPNPKYASYAWKPVLEEAKNLARVASKLELIRSKNYGNPITITSGIRTMEQNIACGGASCSYHLSGNAADFTCKNLPQVYNFIESNWHSLFSECSECFYYPNKHFIHLALKRNALDAKHVISINFKK